MDGKKERSLLIQMGYSVYLRVRDRIAQDNGWCCAYCEDIVSARFNSGDKLATITHRIPLSRGGTWKRYNLACACRSCNEEKSNMTDEEYRFYQFLANHVEG